jgi:hypothetical protein
MATIKSNCDDYYAIVTRFPEFAGHRLIWRLIRSSGRDVADLYFKPTIGCPCGYPQFITM